MENPKANPPLPNSSECCPLPKSVLGRSALDVALEAAGTAGSMLIPRFGQSLTVTSKGRGNVVTDVDLEVEQAVRHLLTQEFPDIPILGEESSPTGSIGDGWTWIVDPIDGTRNFASGVPHFSTVVALACCGNVRIGVNHDPIRRETFHAVSGHGAFLNGAQLQVVSDAHLADGILGMDLTYSDEGAASQLALALDLWPGMQTIRILGSAALGLAYVAAGRFHLFFHDGLEPWDQAAGILLVREAGGVVTDRRGAAAGLRSDGIVAGPSRIHQEFLESASGSRWSGRSVL